MAVGYKVVSIGTLSMNPLWGESSAVRTPHATTTLVTCENRRILVDPSLPGPVLEARLFERAGLRIGDIDTIFLTTFRACHRAGLAAFEGAKWYLHEREKEWARQRFEQMLLRGTNDGSEARRFIEDDLSLLLRCEPAPDELADQVGLFPSPGASPGACGLLLTPPVGAVLIAGDAVISREYLEGARVWDHSYDVKQAQQSLADILEIADLIVPGHDNIFPLLGRLAGI